MTISSSVLSAAGPNKYNRIPSTISPTITQASNRVVCVTVIIGYCKPRKGQLRCNLIGADGGKRSACAKVPENSKLLNSQPLSFVLGFCTSVDVRRTEATLAATLDARVSGL